MKRPPRNTAKQWLSGAAAGLVAFSVSDRLLAMPARFSGESSTDRSSALGRRVSYSGNVLGTSFELVLEGADLATAAECRRQVLAEIERLRLILSTYDLGSEISRVRAGGAVESPELAEVLSAYDIWSARTGGALSVNLAEVKRAWHRAAGERRLPDADALRRAFAVPRAFNVDALGKGYIVDRAAEIARRIASRGLVNIGGDIRSWGDRPWAIGVANPADPAENSPVLGTFALRDAAVATSGGYARFLTIDGRRYSHIIDARSLWPADERFAATVMAPDCMSANALATAGCILGAADGFRLAQANGAVSLFAAAAQQPLSDIRSSAGADGAATDRWPENYRVTIDLALKYPEGDRIRNPYVVTWVEDAQGRILRTISLWGTQEKYQEDLYNWWELTGENYASYESVTSGSREAGKYTIRWDGTDNQGNPLPKGDYKIFVEISRQDGGHVTVSTSIACGTEPQRAKIRATSESEDLVVAYGPGG